ncbi:MAG: ABC transporter permease [Firmicutes bacterium]|nr:ABC transporter permease [Bacillota bacterium]
MIESMAIATIIYYTLFNAAPLIFAAIGGTFTERSGVINIALEGIMVIGAFFGAAFAMTSGNPWIGVLAAVIAGAILSWLHAVVSIKFKANQVVSGTAINLLAVGVASFMMRAVYGSGGQLLLGTSPSLPRWSLSNLLAPVPILGDFMNTPFMTRAFGEHAPGVYLAFVAVIVGHIVLFKTPLGLRLRAVGEHPRAADTLGVNVPRMRYLGVLISGVLAGFAGSILSISPGMSGFVVGMIAGRGFIALAAMIFGKWTPFGAMGACLLFGLSTSFEVSASVLFRNVPFLQSVPSQFYTMLPYIITMLALAGFIGRSTPPAASGIPYETNQ